MARANSAGIEGRKVIDALPYADGMHRKAELGRNCDQNAALVPCRRAWS